MSVSRHVRHVVAAAALLMAGASPDAAAEPGLVVHYYGEPTFWYYGGTTTVPDLDLVLDLGRLPWPPPNWELGKGAIFHRNTGWSLLIRGTLTVPTAGAYRFTAAGSPAALRLDGRIVALDDDTPTTLPAGPIALRLYLKGERPQLSWTAACHLRWQGPDMAAPEPIPAAQLEHTRGDWDQAAAIDFDIPLDDPQTRFWHRLDYTFDLPEDGFYAVVGHFPGLPRQVELTLDGKFLYHLLQRLNVDPAETADYGLGFRNTCRTVRYLTGGRHTLTVAGYDGTYPFAKEDVQRFFENSRFGIERVPAADPRATRCIFPEDREDLVCRRGEPLTIRIEQATRHAATYTLRIMPQRGDDRPVWTGSTTLPANERHALGRITYPCDGEGAFEYTVRDADGRIVDGPSAFVVIDPTPLPLPPPGSTPAPMQKVLVDSVDCTLATDGEHQFRDNGTSRVVHGPAGAYRITGDADKVRLPYRMKNPLPGVERVLDPKQANCAYDAMDWFAYTLKVRHPGKAHLVIAHVPNDVKRLVSVWGVDHVTGNYNTGVLEAGDAPAGAPFTPLSFIVWPNGDAIDVLTFCDSQPRHAENFRRQGAIARIEILELPAGLPPLPAPSGGFAPDKEFGWWGEQVNLGIEQRTMPPLWPTNEPVPGVVDTNEWAEGPYHDWRALLTAWERFGEFSRWRGDHLLVWPVNSYSMGRLRELSYMERDFESYARTYRSRLVDPRRRDQFKMILLVCQKYGVQVVADFQMSRWYDYVLLATDTEHRYTADGLYLTDANGQVVRYPALVLNPAHPLARRYLIAWLEEIAENYGGYPAFQGVRIRQSGWHTNNSGYFFSKDWAYDDFTVGLFEQETGIDVGVDATATDKFARRRHILQGKLHGPWFQWRADKVTSLRRELLAALRRHAPQARLYAWLDERLMDPETGSGLDPAQLAGRRELGYCRTVQPLGPHIENTSLDPVAFANFDIREPASLRRTPATAMGRRGHEYPGNPCAGAGASIRPPPYQLEPLAEALAEAPLATVYYGGPWVLPPVDDGIRGWGRAWQAIPALTYTRHPATPTGSPVVCWQAAGDNDYVCYLVNTTPHTAHVLLAFAGPAAKLRSLVSGNRLADGPQAAVDIDPYMVLPLAATAATGLATIELVYDRQYLPELAVRIKHLQAIAPRAAGLVAVRRGAGLPYVKVRVAQEFYDDGAWGRRDFKTTFAELADPVLDAWQRHDIAAADRGLALMLADHSWWYQVLGWPPDSYHAEEPAKPYTSPAALARIIAADPAPVIGRNPFVNGDALLVPSGRAEWPLKVQIGGQRALRVWMVAGEGYGPVTVQLDGTPIGVLGVGQGQPYHAHFALPSPLCLHCGDHRLTFLSEGGQGLVLTAAELTPVPPEPIRCWSAIGLFDKQSKRDGWEGFDTVFPPEHEFALNAVYSGLDNTPARWRQIDIGDDKFIQLLERFYPYDYTRGNGVAYLTCWIHSPDPRPALLYYAFDWFGRVWVNDQVVVPAAEGPWRDFATVQVHLHRGWNRLLVKTSCGRSSWKANLALSNPGDLEFSPLPPGPQDPEGKRSQ